MLAFVIVRVTLSPRVVRTHGVPDFGAVKQIVLPIVADRQEELMFARTHSVPVLPRGQEQRLRVLEAAGARGQNFLLR